MEPTCSSTLICAGDVKPGKVVSSFAAGRGTHCCAVVGDGMRFDSDCIEPGIAFEPSTLSVKPFGLTVTGLLFLRAKQSSFTLITTSRPS
jgi:hypothetical protein